MAQRRLKNRDLADDAYRLKSLVFSLYFGVLAGVPLGAIVAELTGNDMLVGMVLGFVLMWAGSYFGSQWISIKAGEAAEVVYNPSGDSTPHKREYSYEKSLVARGRYEDALAAFELAAIEYSDDPDPYFEAARLCKNQLERPEDAITWYRRARADAVLTQGQELLAMQDIVELYVHRLRRPRRAIPELAMLADRFPETPAGQAARGELAEMREMIAREHQGFEKFTEQFLKKVGRDTLSQAAGLTREEVERQLITEALEESGGDRAKAAEQLGVEVAKLEATMKDLGMA